MGSIKHNYLLCCSEMFILSEIRSVLNAESHKQRIFHILDEFNEYNSNENTFTQNNIYRLISYLQLVFEVAEINLHHTVRA